MKGKTLRRIRIAVSVACALAVTAGLIGLGTWCKAAGNLIGHIQIFYAVVTFSFLTFITWLLVTLIFGRVYCSSVCPLGTFQDLASRLLRLTPSMMRRHRYAYRRPMYRLQYILLIAIVVAMMAGVTYVIDILDPYIVYCNFFIILGCDPVLGGELAIATQIITASLIGQGVACLTFLLVGLIAARSGRMICNTVCPIGTTLGFVSRYAVFQIDIDTDKCIHCNRCVDRCKCGCINPADSTVDGSRCVVCFDCLPECQNSAIRYSASRKRLSDVMMQPISGVETSATASISPGTSNLEKIEKK